MVGWMGGCCCGDGGGGGSDPLGCQTNYPTTFADDFSPSHDPEWTTFVPELTTVNGVCQCTGQWWLGFPWTYGRAYKQLKKATLQGTIEASVKLVSWPTAPTPNQQIRAYKAMLSAVFTSSGNWRVLAYRDNVLNRYMVEIGNLFYPTNTAPQSGDTFGFRMRNFLAQLPLASQVVAQTLEVVVNGAVIWSSDTDPFWYADPSFNACDFLSGIEIEQAAFPQFPMFPGQTIIKLDDYAIDCQ